MKQLAKYLPLSLLVLTLSACNLNIDIGGVHGDGNVQAESRATPKTFTEIKAANGWMSLLLKMILILFVWKQMKTFLN